MASKLSKFGIASLIILSLQVLTVSPNAAPKKPNPRYDISQDYIPHLRTTGSPKFEVSIPSFSNVRLGTKLDVPVTIIGDVFKLEAFDFLIKYDPQVVQLRSVEPGTSLFTGRGSSLETFGFRIGEQARCGDSDCESGFVRVFSVIKSNNNLMSNHWGFDEETELFTLKFLVTNDYTFHCETAQINFVWYDCLDNTVHFDSSASEDVQQNGIAVAKTVYSNEKPLQPDSVFPSFGGIINSCLESDSLSCLIDFYQGRIEFFCQYYIDDRGDVTLNAIPNEIADYELFREYFLKGISVFTINTAGQIASTDVNGDGETLKLEDLMYLNEIIIGDASPVRDSTILGANTIRNNTTTQRAFLYSDNQIDVIWLIVLGKIDPISKLGKHDIEYNFDGTHTRILITEPNGFSAGARKLFQYTGSAKILEAQAATTEGIEIILTISETQ